MYLIIENSLYLYNNLQFFQFLKVLAEEYCIKESKSIDYRAI